MPEKNVFPGIDESYFRELEDVQLEPMLASVFADIRVYNQLLSQEYLDGERINEIMRELDDKWRELMGKYAIITGFCSFPNGTQISGMAPLQRDYYERQEVLFNGVLPIPIDQAWDKDGNEIHKYKLYIQLIREGIASNEESTHLQLTGNADVDDIISLEFPGVMSRDRAKHWLEHYHADAIGEIDVRLLNPSSEECEMVDRLTDLVVDTRDLYIEDEALAVRSAEALSIYTNGLFSFDRDMPYDAVLHGDAWTMYEDAEAAPSEISEPTRVPMTVSQLVWVGACDDEDGILRPHLDARILSPDKDTIGYHILLPLATVQEFQSFRYSYFSDQSE